MQLFFSGGCLSEGLHKKKIITGNGLWYYVVKKNWYCTEQSEFTEPVIIKRIKQDCNRGVIIMKMYLTNTTKVLLAGH